MGNQAAIFKQRQQLLFCFCAPAASGKSTICRLLKQRDDSLFLSVSTTSRLPRAGEVPGEHYHFISSEEFQKRVASGDFVEFAEFGQSKYGTEKSNFESSAANGQDLLLDIDIQGVRQLRTLYPRQVVTFFIFPPSLDILKKRFAERATDSPERIAERLAIAEGEIAVLRQPDFSDYLLINDDLEHSVNQAAHAISTERLRLSRQMPGYLSKILDT